VTVLVDAHAARLRQLSVRTFEFSCTLEPENAEKKSDSKSPKSKHKTTLHPNTPPRSLMLEMMRPLFKP
jgi:hypothetical protein